MTWFSSTKRTFLILVAQVALIGLNLFASGNNHPAINIMGPLYVGDPNRPVQNIRESAWNELREQLKLAKSVGIDAVSTDIWWGLVESGAPGVYDWGFYDRLVEMIKEADLHWVPILSFHQLGGNVGDVGFIPIPRYIWTRYQNDPAHFPNQESMMFKSEQGNTSREYVSFWATPLILDDLKRFMAHFRDHFGSQSHVVDEINISLGPSGELRYPSYNQHDSHVTYPARGAIQAYSLPAVQGFRNAMKVKYETLEALKKAWGYEINSFEQIFPPNPELLKDRFWANNEHLSPYGRDFFDYYNEVLVQHGQLILDAAESVLSTKESPFRHAALGGKIPGVHWHLSSDRSAEASAGLIRTSYENWTSLDAGYGYADTLRVFAPSQGRQKRILTFTALEMSDYRDEDIGAHSRAKTLVRWIAEASHARQIEIEGENALGSELINVNAWKNITDALIENKYKKITLLRLNEIANDPRRLQLLREFHAQMHVRPMSCSKALSGGRSAEGTHP